MHGLDGLPPRRAVGRVPCARGHAPPRGPSAVPCHRRSSRRDSLDFSDVAVCSPCTSTPSPAAGCRRRGGTAQRGGAAVHARRVGDTPCRLFVALLRDQWWEVITQEDEDQARRLLRGIAMGLPHDRVPAPARVSLPTHALCCGPNSAAPGRVAGRAVLGEASIRRGRAHAEQAQAPRQAAEAHPEVVHGTCYITVRLLPEVRGAQKG